MKNTISAEYLSREGYNEINDREIDLDQYTEVDVKSLDDGINVIMKNDLNGVGNIYEKERNRWNEYRVLKKHCVDNGVIWQTLTEDL